ncbi:hypothetical protein PFISCL1PPCAC_19390 [Pristionchus fissidentatus]|uniref:Sushi domain-containing protein n=1 Tax=Pristionchus fissidentatus TaxID=1538716 RepID=A0AAV5WCL7_9BILA|nr:hypothetical protein PFISCL1PPCAC_19390 [Pristionchus fissidentatus]
MPQVSSSPPPNPFDASLSTFNQLLPSTNFNTLKPNTSYRRCGRVRQSTADCPDGRICSSYKHLGEHRITCPHGHIAVELPDGHLELMMSSLVCPEGISEWTAENSNGDLGQRVGSDVTITCIQANQLQGMRGKDQFVQLQTCSPASFLVDMDDQCMLYECEEGKTLFVRSRYGWQPSSHLVCGPGGEYLAEGKDNVGTTPTVTCVIEGESLYAQHQRRRAHRRKFYSN